ncbi:MAG TPA: glycoside hydrolase family 6 protein [Ktedonobacteraceae bacterium]
MSLVYAPLRHYQLLRQIGSGGTGMTYLARDTRTLREVVVKVVRIDDAFQGNETLTRRMEKLFIDQMQAIAHLTHPRIVPVLDFGLERGQQVSYAYLTMPHYPAGSLADWLSQAHNRAALFPSFIFSFLAQTAEVLHYAHERGVIHQDIKPSNFLLSAPSSQLGGFPDLLLADFGIAPFFAATSSQGLSQSHYVRSTSPYLAPEKWNGRAVPASDQYALAVMAFYLLTGIFPFQGALGQIIYQHQEVQPPAPSHLNPQLDSAIDKIFKRALAKEPAKRFPSIRAFGREFARFQVLPAGQSGFQPHRLSYAPSNAVTPLQPEQQSAQPAPLLPPGLDAPLAVAPPYPAPGVQSAPLPHLHPSMPMTILPQAENAPASQPALDVQPGEQRPSMAPVTPLQSAETFNPGEQRQIPADADPDATLIARPSLTSADADPDATLSPPATPLPDVLHTLADADPDATFIARPSIPLSHSETEVDTDKRPAVRPATPPQTGISDADNASNAIQTINLPAGSASPMPGNPNTGSPPRHASAPGLPAMPSRPPIRQETSRPGNISPPRKTLLLILLALVVLTGGGTLLFRSIAASGSSGNAAPSPAFPTQRDTTLPIEHVTNPYAGAQGFINSDWAAKVKAGARQVGGALGRQEARVAQYSTAVWLSSIAAVKGGANGSKGLKGRLDAAETQAASSKLPIVITLVLADLPDRECANPASNSELHIARNGLRTYESSYIDTITATLKQARYHNLRVVAIIEPNILPTLVTGIKIARCVAASSTYILGIQYALNKLHALPNVYNYIDIAHPDWLGWNDRFRFTVSLIATIIKGTAAGVKSIDGFVSNIDNYVPTSEPYLTANQVVGGKPVRSATFYLGNPYVDMLTYDRAMRNAFIAAGFSGSIGMLIDTSRNGWGGPARPSGPGASKDLNTFVNETRIDRRFKRNDWCNQPGGIGARPQANPISGISAFVWIKQPGLSDGTGTLIPRGRQNPSGQSPDSMCAPTSSSNAQNTGAMANAPISGSWFQAAFDTLVQNAYPPF